MGTKNKSHEYSDSGKVKRMCGIAGELNWSARANREAVNVMVSGIAHRGPDDRGLWSSPNGVCALGHARLSIVDLSLAGHQPMLDPLTGNAIVFNGEIYNFQTLRKDCESAGDVFKSHSDTEVILALYRRHGFGCLKFLRGMFALAIWDEQRQQIFLARDRVGKKPLNYSVTKTGLAFCSELDPLSRHSGVDNGIDLEALELYLQCQFIPAPWTIYRGIRKLPPAHYAIYDRNGLKIERYWEIDYRDKIQISEADALDALEEKLTEAVRLRMIADVPLGALLSGGVDSSVVVALMAKLSKEPVNTFSIGFEEEALNELPWAQQAAARCGTQHHPEIVKGEVEHLLPNLARHYGEPFADSSAVPSFFVSATARRHVTVALNGDGGDELLGGYPRYWLPESALRASALFGEWMSPAQLTKLAPQLLAAKTIPMRVVRRLLMQYANPELRSVLMFAGFWSDPVRRELLPNGSDTLLPDWRRGWLERAFAHADNPVDRMLWMDNHTYLPGDLLVKMDIASMHCGLETRSPLLDHEAIEFCARLPVKHKVKDRVGKHLLKKLAERYFPVGFVHRRKMGFGVPLGGWLRGPLRKVLRETLLDVGLMAPLSAPVIERTLREFETGGNEHESRLWALLVFGVWRSQQEANL
jgi:asparagine synthase (glutamine-hydrolysing)